MMYEALQKVCYISCSSFTYISSGVTVFDSFAVCSLHGEKITYMAKNMREDGKSQHETKPTTRPTETSKH